MRTEHRADPDQPKTYNRVRDVMEHVPWYTFKDQARLAADIGVAPSTVSRFLRGQTRPTFSMACALTGAVERRLGRRLDPRELISLDGRYPTANVCRLLGCPGCLPRRAYDAEGSLQPGFEGVAPGEWAVYPTLAGEGR